VLKSAKVTEHPNRTSIRKIEKSVEEAAFRKTTILK